MIITNQIKMDFMKRGNIPQISAVQGESCTRAVELSLYANGKDWPIPEDITVRVRYRKSDGTGGLYDTLPDGTAAWSIAGNVLTVTLAPQMLTAAGFVTFQTELIRQEKCLATFSVQALVEQDPSADVVESDNYIHLMQWLDMALEQELEAVMTRIDGVLAEIGVHNLSTDAHEDIRGLIRSTDGKISALRTEKVGVSDIVDDLVTGTPNKPLSAAQGVALKAMINAMAETAEVGAHNQSPTAHSDIRNYLYSVDAKANALGAEKVSYYDIVDNLVTGLSNKPLSAAQGMALKALIDGLPEWTKEPEKPAYTAEEVGAAPVGHTHAQTLAVGPGAHNGAYRGDSLGTAVTEAQWAQIKAGTFNGLYIGDYWTINGTIYRIAAFDYYYNTGDSACTKHHITLVPDGQMYTASMNDTLTTDGAYVGSKMYTEGLNQAKAKINNDFGENHILNHRRYLPNAVTDGYVSGGSWYDSTVELMNELNVYGSRMYGSVKNGTATPNIGTIDRTQFPLFFFRPDMINSRRQMYWLRDVTSGTQFASLSYYGTVSQNNATNSGGVRPAFSIYQE